ncbi:MAG TPA: DUF190 domain-containing protein [Chromatiales bacterium]|nr:DUF190 domain-containing protein [Chromatiales bacterium]
MNNNAVTVVRVYLTEGEAQLKSLLKRLRNWEKVRGVTVFRGISGFGESGVFHDASILDLSLNLPLVVEFFDAPDKVAAIVDHLNETIKPGHIITWTAQVNG